MNKNALSSLIVGPSKSERPWFTPVESTRQSLVGRTRELRQPGTSIMDWRKLIREKESTPKNVISTSALSSSDSSGPKDAGELVDYVESNSECPFVLKNMKSVQRVMNDYPHERNLPIVSKEEVMKHCTPDDLWMALAPGEPRVKVTPKMSEVFKNTNEEKTSEGKKILSLSIVYNCTQFQRFHPGGMQTIRLCAGQDATNIFNSYHPWVNAPGLMGPYAVGVVLS